MATGPYGAELAKRKRPSNDEDNFSMSQFGTPFMGHHHLATVLARLKLAPLPDGAERMSRLGHLLFSYRPDKQLTGDDETDSVMGLPDINFGLHQRVLYEEKKDSGIKDNMMPLDILRYKEWPINVEEFLGERMIVPVGVRNQDPNDIRFEGQIPTVPSIVEGLSYDVPWIWGDVKLGSIVGLRVGLCVLNRQKLTNPRGVRLGETASRPVLQLMPMVLDTGVEYHGKGTGEQIDIELDFPNTKKVSPRKRTEDEFGLPLGPFESSSSPTTEATMEYVTRESGFFIRIGTVEKMKGKRPTREEAEKAVRTYDGLNARTRAYCHLGLSVCAHPMLRRN